MKTAAVIALALLVAPWLVARLTPDIVYMDNWPDGRPKVRAVSSRTTNGDFEMHGEYRSFHQNGAVASEGFFENGDEHGPWRWYYDDGSLMAECGYDHGDGEYRSYHRDGSPAWSGRMEDRQRSGLWKAFDAEGRPLREGHYVDGLQDGEWQYWSYGDSVEHYTGNWDRGQLLEEDGPPTFSPELPLSISAHAAHALLFLLWLVAPLPLLWVWLSRSERPETERVLALLVGALAFQMAMGQLLLSVSLFQRSALSVGALALLIAGVLRWRRERPALPMICLRGEAAVAGVLLVGVFALTRLWTALVEAPNNFDSLAYHLPVMAEWAQRGQLVYRAELGQVGYYAYGWEVISAVTMSLLGEDALIAWPNLVAAAVWLLALVILARRLGAGSVAAAIAALSLLAMREVVERLVAIQPDLPLAAFATASLVFTGFPSRDARSWAWPLAASVGLLLAVKMTGWVYLIAGVDLVLVWRRSLRVRREQLWPIVFALLLGGFWYFRNWIHVGNPLGLLEIPFLGLDGSMAAGTAYKGSLARLFSPAALDHWRIVWGAAYGALGPGLLMVLAAGVVGVVRASAALRWLLAALILAVVIYWNTPYSADNGSNDYVLTGWMQNNLRFAFTALGLLVVLAAAGLQRMGNTGRVVAASALVVGIGWSVVETIGPRYVVLLASALAVVILLATRVRVTALRVSIATLLLLAVVATYSGRQARHESRLQYYGDSYEYVLRYVPPGTTLGTVMTQNRYPWVGPRLQREVRSAVPVENDADAWFKQLERDGIDALLVGYGTSSETGRVQNENVRPWLQSQQSPFELRSGFESQRRDVELWVRVD